MGVRYRRAVLDGQGTTAGADERESDLVPRVPTAATPVSWWGGEGSPDSAPASDRAAAERFLPARPSNRSEAAIPGPRRAGDPDGTVPLRQVGGASAAPSRPAPASSGADDRTATLPTTRGPGGPGDDRTEQLPAPHDALHDAAPIPQAYRPPAQRGPSEAPTIPDRASAPTGWNPAGAPGQPAIPAQSRGPAFPGGPVDPDSAPTAVTPTAADSSWRSGEAPTSTDGSWGNGGAAATPGGPAGSRQPDENPSRYDADAPVPEAPPSYPGQHRAPRPKYFVLRIAVVMVLVLGAAIGVAVTVIGGGDPDTAQVANDLPPAATQATDPTAGPEAAPSSPQPDPKEQQQAIDNAQSRAEEKAADAQADAAETAEDAAKAREKRAEETGTTGAPVPTAPVDCESFSGNKNMGCALLSEFGFPSSEMTCLEQLWTKESGWNEKAENTGSGAYGIPQALPGDKMATVADDWRTNPATQIRWGLGYIKGRYQTPCGAWEFFQNNNHY